MEEVQVTAHTAGHSQKKFGRKSNPNIQKPFHFDIARVDLAVPMNLLDQLLPQVVIILNLL
jgi:hypothetical protein